MADHTMRGALGKVLVTGVGGAAGFSLARTLLRRGIPVVGVDADHLACGLHLDGIDGYVIPYAHDAAYLNEIVALRERTRYTTIVPTLDEELISLIDLAPTFERHRVRRWLPSAEAVRSCWDKLRFAEVLTAAGVPTPPTYLPGDLAGVTARDGLVVKPRRGRGSRGVYYCASIAQAAVLCDLVTDPIIQGRVTGQEFTADCLAEGTGRCAVVLRSRDRVRGGLSMAGTTFADAAVSAAVRAAVAAVGLAGPCCVQGFKTGHADDPVYITEINARFAGGHALSEAAGADLTGRYLAALAGLPVNYDVSYHIGVSMTRYVGEYIFTPEDVVT